MSDFWSVSIDFDAAEDTYAKKRKTLQLQNWRQFESDMAFAISNMAVPVIYAGNLTPHQTESLKHDPSLNDRFVIEISDKFCFLIRR